MNSNINIFIIVEGKTEQRFIWELLAPYMAEKGIYLRASIPGRRKHNKEGGNVKFSRVKMSIEQYLKQRKDTNISLLVDYYGISSDWPGYAKSKKEKDHTRKAAVMNQATAAEVQKLFPEQNRNERFIPYVSMHEIESLYFSDPACIAKHLNIREKDVVAIVQECGEPEKINDHTASAPSKRLKQLSGNFEKTSIGMTIASEIGISKMREACPLFNDWLNRLEALAGDTNGKA